MRNARNLAFLVLVVLATWSPRQSVSAAADCVNTNGPESGGTWCDNTYYSCDYMVQQCCGEDWSGSCERVDCGLILPPPHGACCAGIEVTCETPL